MARAAAKLNWLEQAQADLNEDPAFRKLGSTDLTLGLAIGDEARLVRFEAFEIAAIQSVDGNGLRDADLVITMSPREWNAYLRKRSTGKGPTLLTLALDQPECVRAAGPLQHLLLERYSLTLQAFVDRGAVMAA